MVGYVIMALLATNCAAVVSESFECFTCANCQDRNSFYIVECRDVPGGNDTDSCVRTETRRNGRIVVNRHCDVHGEECADIGPDSCTTDGDVVTCCCEEDLCNGADSINSVAVATAAAILTSYCYFNAV